MGHHISIDDFNHMINNTINETDLRLELYDLFVIQDLKFKIFITVELITILMAIFVIAIYYLIL